MCPICDILPSCKFYTKFSVFLSTIYQSTSNATEMSIILVLLKNLVMTATKNFSEYIDPVETPFCHAIYNARKQKVIINTKNVGCSIFKKKRQE